MRHLLSKPAQPGLTRSNYTHRQSQSFSLDFSFMEPNHKSLLAGAGGFEPPHGGTKNRCLPTWLRPSIAAHGCREARHIAPSPQKPSGWLLANVMTAPPASSPSRRLHRSRMVPPHLEML